MQLRSKITVARNIRIHHHSLLNAKRKNAVVLGFKPLIEVADGMVKQHSNNWKSDSTPFTWHPISI